MGPHGEGACRGPTTALPPPEFDVVLRAGEILGFGRTILPGPGAPTMGPAPAGPAADTKCGGRLNRLAAPMFSECC